MWNVEFTDDFEKWFASLTAQQQDAIDRSVKILEKLGPHLGRPHVDSVKGSRHTGMKELRTQVKGRPLRTLFIFDPRRTAILLIGGDKTGDRRFYDRMIATADALYQAYLNQIRDEGLLP